MIKHKYEIEGTRISNLNTCSAAERESNILHGVSLNIVPGQHNMRMDQMHGFCFAPSTNINFDVIYLFLAYIMSILVFDLDLPLSGLLPQE